MNPNHPTPIQALVTDTCPASALKQGLHTPWSRLTLVLGTSIYAISPTGDAMFGQLIPSLLCIRCGVTLIDDDEW